MTTQPNDLIIVGGGMAGLTAGIYAARAGLSVQVLEKEICGGLANWTHVVENFPSHKSIHGMDLMEKVKHHAHSCGALIEEVCEVTEFKLNGMVKQVVCDDQTYQARAVILAMGRVPRKLTLESDWQDHIHYCSLCDGNLYPGKKIIVVGGGNSGFDESLYLVGLGIEHITIVEEMPTCLADRLTQKKVMATGRVSLKTRTRITGIDPCSDGAKIALKHLDTQRTEQVSAQGIFVFIGQTPGTERIHGIVDLDEQGYIVADSNMHTSLPGVFTAGDIINKPHRQLTTAAADGTIAALETEKFLRQSP